MRKIVISGAGIAGLTAAINLAKSGFDVEVYEKEKDVGCRFHGDFQGIENWTTEEDTLKILKEMNIKINFPCIPYKRTDFYSHDLTPFKINFKRPFFYLVKRGSSEKTIDQGLKKQALEIGVKIFFNREITIEKADIIATGPCKVSGIVRGVTFKTNMKDKAFAILDDDIAPKGYAYLLVNNKKATIATVILKDFEKSNEYLRRAKKKFRKIVNFNSEQEREFAGYGNYFIRKTWIDKGRFYIGERAGLLDFLFGFGMRYAMLSGFLAARSISHKEDYNLLVKRNMLNILKTSLSNRFLFEMMGNQGYKHFLSLLQKEEDPGEKMRKYYNPSLLKKIIFPVAKLKFRKRI